MHLPPSNVAKLIYTGLLTPPAAEQNQFRHDLARKLSANLYDM